MMNGLNFEVFFECAIGREDYAENDGLKGL